MTVRSRLRASNPDVVLAIVVTAGAEAALLAGDQDPLWAAIVLTAAMTLPFALRRSHTMAAITMTVGSVLLQSALVDGTQPLVPLCLAIAAYSGGHELDGRRAWAGLLMIVLPLWVGLAATGSEVGEFVSIAVIFGAVWAFGRGLRERGRRVTELAAHATRLEEETAKREAAAAEAERARVARELHDIVSHSISVIAVQTQAVRRRLEPGNEREARDLRAVEETARDAMAEMRRLFGVLRAGGEPGVSLSPQPGLAQLPRLIDQHQSAGLRVAVHTTGEPVDLSMGVDLTAYRVIQEALTNAHRHGEASEARVRLAYEPGALTIAVENDGPVAHMNGGGGHGLIGMRERVTLYGGTLDVGPRPGGGFRIHARLPLAAEPTA